MPRSTGYARRTLFDSDQFANRAASTLQADSVKTLVAERVTDQLVLANQSDLIAVRPLIESAVASIISGSPFRTLFVKAVRDAHRAVFKHNQNTVVLTLADVGTVAAAGIEKLRPEPRGAAGSGRSRAAGQQRGREGHGRTRAGGPPRPGARDLLAALTLVAGVGAIVVSPERRRTVAQLGVGVAAAGIVVVVAYVVARAIVLARFSDPEDRAAAGAVWSAFLGDLRTLGWVLAGSGAVVAAAATSRLRPLELESRFKEAFSLVTTEPQQHAHADRSGRGPDRGGRPRGRGAVDRAAGGCHPRGGLPDLPGGRGDPAADRAGAAGARAGGRGP